MQKLKNCPFCGEKAEIFQVPEDSKTIMAGTYIVGCDGGYGSLCCGYIWNAKNIYTTEELAIRFWNMREDESK